MGNRSIAIPKAIAIAIRNLEKKGELATQCTYFRYSSWETKKGSSRGDHMPLYLAEACCKWDHRDRKDDFEESLGLMVGKAE